VLLPDSSVNAGSGATETGGLQGSDAGAYIRCPERGRG
jgi:hypothetical protein